MSEAELAAVDRVRGEVPLSTWLKRLAADAVAADAALAVGALPVSARARLPEARAAGHRAGCGCLNCERARGSVS